MNQQDVTVCSMQLLSLPKKGKHKCRLENDNDGTLSYYMYNRRDYYTGCQIVIDYFSKPSMSQDLILINRSNLPCILRLKSPFIMFYINDHNSYDNR